MNSLKPTSFNLNSEPATVTIACTVSKRRKTDTHSAQSRLRTNVETVARRPRPRPPTVGLLGQLVLQSRFDMLRLDLAAAGIAHERDGAMIDFHSFRCYRVTQGDHVRQVESRRNGNRSIVERGAIARYTKIPQAAIADLVEAVPVPRLPLKIVG